MKLTVKLSRWFIAALALAAVAAPCTGQQDNDGQRGRRPDPNLASREVEREVENDRKRWGFGIGTRQPNSQQYQQLVFKQVSEDFLRIQVLNDELAQAASPGVPLDMKFVAQAASDIRKRSERLKFNLALPEPAERTKRPKPVVGTEPEQVRAALETLGPLIAKFAHNPVFKEAKVVNVQMSTQALCDLEEIIELSGQVKKRSEQLYKAARRAN